MLRLGRYLPKKIQSSHLKSPRAVDRPLLFSEARNKKQLSQAWLYLYFICDT